LKKPIVIGTSVVLVAMLLSACGKNNNVTPSPSVTISPTGTEAVQAANAEALYTANCISCHGADLKGKMGGKTNLQHVGAELSTDQIIAQITNGGGGMPPFNSRLKADEIKALADWLAAKK